MPMEGIPHPARGGIVTGKAGRVHFVMPGVEVATMPYTILTGLVLAKGSVLGRVTATGKLKLSASAAGDGSEVPMAILQEDLDTSSPAGDVVYAPFIKGKFNPEALILGAGHTIASVTAPLRDRGIFLEYPF